MIGLMVFCEGRAEQGFCNQVLRPHLFPNYERILHTIEIAHSKHHGRVDRGGVPAHYATMRRDIANELKSRKARDLWFSILIDPYALPNDFPGKKEHTRNAADPHPYVEALERAFGEDIGDSRFIPHLQLHEYETILVPPGRAPSARPGSALHFGSHHSAGPDSDRTRAAGAATLIHGPSGRGTGASPVGIPSDPGDSLVT